MNGVSMDGRVLCSHERDGCRLRCALSGGSKSVGWKCSWLRHTKRLEMCGIQTLTILISAKSPFYVVNGSQSTASLAQSTY